MTGTAFSREHPLGDRPKARPACEDIERLRKHLRNLVAAANAVLDQIDSAGNVLSMGAFDRHDLKNLRDAIAEANKGQL